MMKYVFTITTEIQITCRWDISFAGFTGFAGFAGFAGFKFQSKYGKKT